MPHRPKKKKVIWKPLPGSQCLALTAPVNHIMIDGTRGGGKTDVQIMRFRRHVGQGYGAFWRGVIIGRSYKALDDIVARTKRWFPKFKDGAKFLASQAAYKWTWPTGEELLLRVMEKPGDYDKFHGQEFPFIGWNEVTQWSTSECYDLMMSCNRASFLPSEHSPDPLNPLPEMPLLVVGTTNPSGPGHNWVKSRFVDIAPAGKVVRNITRVFNPRTQKEEDVVKTQVRLFSSYKENKYLAPEYIADLVNIRDPNKRKAWLEGDWDVTAGGAIDDLWRSNIHIIDRFPVPAAWKLRRSHDWGSTHPYSTGFWAISNGEEVEVDGETLCYPRGSLIRIAEDYGAERRKTPQGGADYYGHNTGIKLAAPKVAKRAKDLEETLTMLGWIQNKVLPGPADNQIFGVLNTEDKTIAKQMEDEGVSWERSNKSPGTRKIGLQVMRDMLENAVTGEGPGLYVMRNCKAFINTVPVLPRSEKDPDDVDTTAIDHCFIGGTEVHTSTGERKIETLEVGDLIWTREGLKPIIEAHRTPAQPVFEVSFEGGSITGTGNHPVWVGGEWKRIDLLMKGDRLTGCKYQERSKETTAFKSIMGPGFTSVDTIFNVMGSGFTGLFGRLQTAAKSLKASTFTILTGASTTTTRTTLQQSQQVNTCHCMGGPPQKHRGWLGQRIQELLQKATRTSQKQRGQRRERKLGQFRSRSPELSKSANNAGQNMRLTTPRCQSSVTPIVSNAHCIKGVKPKGKADVFNITVAGCHEYFANGILVHNCYDEARYMCLFERPEYVEKLKVEFAM